MDNPEAVVRLVQPGQTVRRRVHQGRTTSAQSVRLRRVHFSGGADARSGVPSLDESQTATRNRRRPEGPSCAESCRLTRTCITQIDATVLHVPVYKIYPIAKRGGDTVIGPGVQGPGCSRQYKVFQ